MLSESSPRSEKVHLRGGAEVRGRGIQKDPRRSARTRILERGRGGAREDTAEGTEPAGMQRAIAVEGVPGEEGE